MKVTLWWSFTGEALDELRAELEEAGHTVEVGWSSDFEPAVQSGTHYARGYSNIYERFLRSPVREPRPRLALC